MNTTLRGVLPALATPLTAEGRANEAAIRKLTQFQLANGVSGLFVCGSMGEGPMLCDDDWRQTLAWVITETASQVPVLANVADTSTMRAIARTRQAMELGADAVVSTLPYYYVHAGLEAERYFTELADASPLPLYIYNLPQRTQVQLSADLLEKLATHPNIKGVKDSSVDPILHFELIRRMQKADFVVLNGCEFFAGASILMGGDGVLLGVCNLCPRLCVDLYEAAQRGEVAEVRRLQTMVSDVTGAFFVAGVSLLSALKCALHLMGIGGPTSASPFAPVTAAQTAQIQAILSRNGLL